MKEGPSHVGFVFLDRRRCGGVVALAWLRDAARLRRCPRCLSVSFAPLIGVGAYVLLGFAYEKAGVWSSWSTQAAALFVLAAVIFAVLRLRRGRSAARISFGLFDHGQVDGRVSFDAACLAAYLLLGVVFAGVLFVWYLGTPDSYAQQFDNISHLGTTRDSLIPACGLRSRRRCTLPRLMQP